MMASAMRSYIGRYAAAPAKRIALFTNNDDGWKTVEAAIGAGLSVAAVVDARPDVAAAHRELAAKSGFAILNGSVDRASAAARTASGKISVALAGGARATIEAEGLAVSGGWNPIGRTDLPSSRPAEMARRHRSLRARRRAARHGGRRRRERRIRARRLPCRRPCCRRGGGRRSRLRRKRGRCPSAEAEERKSLTPLWHVAGKGKAFVDFQNDVTASDIELAAREGFESVEHLKRYTTLGMATDQGKTSNVAGPRHPGRG